MTIHCQAHMQLSLVGSIYTAQQKFSTDFNMMSHFELTLNILFNVINMYGDLEIYVFSCPPEKG